MGSYKKGKVTKNSSHQSRTKYWPSGSLNNGRFKQPKSSNTKKWVNFLVCWRKNRSYDQLLTLSNPKQWTFAKRSNITNYISVTCRCLNPLPKVGNGGQSRQIPKLEFLTPKSSTEGNNCRKQESADWRMQKTPNLRQAEKSRNGRLPLPPPRVLRRKIRPPAGTTRRRRRFESRDRGSARSAPGEGQHCAEAPRRASTGSPRRRPVPPSCSSSLSVETRELLAATVSCFPCLFCCPECRGVRPVAWWSVEWDAQWLVRTRVWCCGLRCASLVCTHLVCI
jgi:hypothetical protein